MNNSNLASLRQRFESHIKWWDPPAYVTDIRSWKLATQEVAKLCGESIQEKLPITYVHPERKDHHYYYDKETIAKAYLPLFEHIKEE